MIGRISQCRGCSSKNLEEVLALRSIPIGDNLSSGVNDLPVYPLGLVLCCSCGLTQLTFTVKHEIVFEHYFSRADSKLDSYQRNQSSVPTALNNLELKAGSTVVEIGCGWGQRLKTLFHNGTQVIGVEPSDDIARLSRNCGNKTITGYFTDDVVEEILRKYGRADLVLVDNSSSFPHPVHISNVDDPLNYAENLARLIKPQGNLYLRAPYVGSIITQGLIDYIYHEHQSYFSFRSLTELLSKVGLCIRTAQICKNDMLNAEYLITSIDNPTVSQKLTNRYQANESHIKLEKPETFVELSNRLSVSRIELRKELATIKYLPIVGYGASIATVSAMYQYEIVKYLEFLVDDNAYKIGLYSPNANLQVRSPQEIYEANAGGLVVLTSRFADMIKKKHSHFAGKIVVPQLAVH